MQLAHNPLPTRWPRFVFTAFVLAVLAPASLSLSAARAAAPPPPVAAVFDAKGLISLTYAGDQLLADGRPAVHSVLLETREKGKDGSNSHVFTPANLETPEVTFDRDTQRLSYTYSWGGINFAYRTDDHVLRIEMRVDNQSRQTIADFSVKLLELAFPQPLKGELSKKGEMVRSLDNLAIVEAAYGTAKVLICVDTIWPPLNFGVSPPVGKRPTRYPLEVRGGVFAPEPHGTEVYPHGLPRVPAGESRTFTFSLRFAGADQPQGDLVGDLYQAFRAYWRPTLQWEDGRPIGAIFLPSDRQFSTAGNPRGWKFFKDDKGFEITSPEGKKRFLEHMMEFADRSVEALKKLNAQGMIVWNIEGEENPHPITYIGDPRMLPILNPEFDEIADEWFKKFRAAGFRTGVTIRPTQIYEKDGQWAHGTGSHGPERNPLGDDFHDVWPEGVPWWRFFPVAERMSRKIAYAKKRWGSTLFYVDTNGVHRPVGEINEFKWMLLDGHTWRRIAEAHPDVLLIPELGADEWAFHAAQWAYTAPYEQLDYSGRVHSPDTVRRLFPAAKIVNYVANTTEDKLAQLHDELVEAVRQGDILMGRGWFFDAQDKHIASIYNDAAHQ